MIHNKRIKILIMMLLISLLNLQAQIRMNSSSTGDLIRADTTVVTVPIDLIKDANAKMIERLYLFDIVNQQDSIINAKDKYITIQKDLIVDKQNLINKENKKVNKYKTTSIISIGLLILTLLFKNSIRNKNYLKIVNDSIKKYQPYL